jgi:glutamyl/glutaminyl-tRNA synthetase
METTGNIIFQKAEDAVSETRVAAAETRIEGTKTRIAPTPSGYLHLGNVLSFTLTAELARRAGASILLRIDDLDRERVNPDYVQDIFGTLNFLQIPWDEGPRNYGDHEREFSQLHRLELYRGALEQLRKEGKLFACVCSRAKVMRDSGDGGYPGTCREMGLAFDSKDCNWRLRTGGAELPAELRDFIVRKKDGFPAYQLTSVMDDLHFGIDLVVRGEDLRSSTLAQQWLALQLGQELGSGFERIHFHHHGLLMESGDRKLSKSAGATSVRYLRQQGKKPAEVYAMIAGMLEMDGRPGSWEDLAAGYGMGNWGKGLAG